MTEKVYINDDFGNRVPMFDINGNLSVQVIMLYAEDKLTETDRRAVDQFAATDEMTRDALDGFASSANPSKARSHINLLNAGIQKRSGAEPIVLSMDPSSEFDYRKLAAGVALLITVGAATFFGSKYLGKEELADNQVIQTADELEEEEEATTRSDSGETEDAEFSAKPAMEEIPVVSEEESRLRDAAANAERTKEQVADVDEVTTQPKAATAQAKDEANAPSRELAASGKTQDDTETDKKKVSAAYEKGKADDKAKEDVAVRKQAAETKLEEQQQRAEAIMQSEMASERSQNEAKQKTALQDTQLQKVGESAESSARYPGGDLAMYRFIEKKKIYTEAMRAQELRGAITVSFDIEPDGQVNNVRVTSGSNGLLNQDALRVVRSMPKWKPAKDSNGFPTKASRTVVIKYGE